MSLTRLLITSTAFAALAVPAAADFNLRILHTNDVHSRIEPINRFDSTCSADANAEGECFGGMARIATAVAEARAGANSSILLDGGDQFQGSLFYTYYKGQAAAELMNHIGYEAMAVGNHEFDDGPEVLRAFMDVVDFPVLMANGDIADEPSLADEVMPSTVIEVGGERIGLIGVVAQDTDVTSSPGPNVSFTDPMAAVQAEVDALTADGVEIIIVLSHNGYGIDIDMAEAVSGIDVIVGGHSHTYLANDDEDAAGPYPTMVGDTAIVQAYAYSRYLGVLDVTFDDDGNLASANGAPRLLDASVAEDPAVVARVAEMAGPLDEIRNQVIGSTTAPINGDRSSCRAEVCEMGVLVADAMLDRVRDQGVQIAIQNGGGLRASIDEGEVTMGEVLTVLPFQNTLATFQLSGANVLAALENGVSQVEDGAGRFPQVAGLRYTWNASAEPGARITSVEVDMDGSWTALDPEAVYGVVSNNFMRAGGDGYSMFETDAINAYDFGPGLELVVAEYLAANFPYTPMTDGRITQD